MDARMDDREKPLCFQPQYVWQRHKKIYSIHLCPIVHHCCKFVENLTNTFQDIVLTSPESAVSSILYSTVTLTFDLLTSNFEFGENV